MAARIILKILRWESKGEARPNLNGVIVAAPHTANRDFIYFMLTAWVLKVPIVWVAKKSMFRLAPIGYVLKKMGGIPIDRAAPIGVVEQLIAIFETSDPIVLSIAPEGTRSYRQYWKSGFYRIATGANVPIILGYLDFGKRESGLSDPIELTGDQEKDLELIAKFYADIEPKHPKRFGPVRLQQIKK